MIENILFFVGFALQIFAWILAGGKLGFRPRRSSGREEMAGQILPAKINNRSFRRFLLLVGAGIVIGYAFSQHDYILLAAQCVLFCILWVRVSLTREQ